MKALVFETMGLYDGGLPLWSLHIERLLRSVRCLTGIEPSIPSGLRADVLAQLGRSGDDIARLVCKSSDDASLGFAFSIETRKRRALDTLRLAPVRTMPQASRDLGHKLADRSYFQACLAEAERQDCDDAVLLGPGDRVRETTMCNLIYRRGSSYQTPDLGALLPGIARALLCERLAVEARPTSLRELSLADAIWVTNAVYGPRLAYLDGDAAPAEPNPLATVWREILAGQRG